MGRKQGKESKQTWAQVKLWSFSSRKYKGEFSPSNPVVILHAKEGEHPLALWASTALQLLRASQATSAFHPVVFVMDYTALLKDMDGERMAADGLGPVSKPLLRMFTKLNAQDMTVYAAGDDCVLLTKLLNQPQFNKQVDSVVQLLPG